MNVRQGRSIILWLAAGGILLGCSDPESTNSSAATGASTTAGSGGGATSGSGGGATSGSGGGATTGSGGGATTGSGGGATTGSGGGTAASTGTFMTTPCTGNLCDIQFIGSGFTPHEGQTVYAGIIPQGSNKGFDWSSSDTVMGGGFSMQGTAVLQKGIAYNLNYYADVDGNGKCEPTQGDHIWRISIPPVQDNVIANVSHHTNFSNLGCGGF